VLIAVLVLVVVAASSGGGGSDTTPTTAKPASAGAPTDQQIERLEQIVRQARTR
jgi:hypothetical protein